MKFFLKASTPAGIGIVDPKSGIDYVKSWRRWCRTWPFLVTNWPDANFSGVSLDDHNKSDGGTAHLVKYEETNEDINIKSANIHKHTHTYSPVPHEIICNRKAIGLNTNNASSQTGGTSLHLCHLDSFFLGNKIFRGYSSMRTRNAKFLVGGFNILGNILVKLYIYI